MGIQKTNKRENQDLRLKIKNLSQQMINIAVDGAGLSPWEADVLVKEIEQVYFTCPELKPLKPGQLQYCCVSATEGPGKPLKQCKMATVNITLIDDSDNENITLSSCSGRQATMRQRRLMRITDEARLQGGLLTQEDIAKILMCDVKTIQRDIKELKKLDITVATRGQQKDIGPGVTHKQLIIQHWLDGKEETAICTATKHSMKAVENYLIVFKRVVYLYHYKSFSSFEIAVTAGISHSLCKEHIRLYEENKTKGIAQHRLKEIENIGSQYYREIGEKKDSQPMNQSKQTWRPA